MSVFFWKPCWTGDFWWKSVSQILQIIYSQIFVAILMFFFKCIFLSLFGYWVNANQRTVHCGGVSSGRVWMLALVAGDRWKVTDDTQHATYDTWFSFFSSSQLSVCLWMFLSIAVILAVLMLVSAYIQRFSLFCMRSYKYCCHWSIDELNDVFSSK